MDLKHKFRNRKSLYDEVVTYIKEQILQGELNPGDRIVETKLAVDLGISQTPIREAIRQLAGEGIIVTVPNKGPIVKKITEKDIFEIYSLREVMEGLAMRLATKNATDTDINFIEDFFNEMKMKAKDDSVQSLISDSGYIHQYIYDLSKHFYIISIYKSISFQIQLMNRLLGVNFNKEYEIEQHEELIVALKQGDPEHAEIVMKKHIENTYLMHMKYIQGESFSKNMS